VPGIVRVGHRRSHGLPGLKSAGSLRGLPHRPAAQGKVIAKHPTQVTVFEEAGTPHLEDPLRLGRGGRDDAGRYRQTLRPSAGASASRSPLGFALGDRVSFDDGKGNAVIGMVAKINRRTASVATDDGRSCRVDFTLLRHVVDV
jgi:hypothetical protein